MCCVSSFYTRVSGIRQCLCRMGVVRIPNRSCCMMVALADKTGSPTQTGRLLSWLLRRGIERLTQLVAQTHRPSLTAAAKLTLALAHVNRRLQNSMGFSHWLSRAQCKDSPQRACTSFVALRVHSFAPLVKQQHWSERTTSRRTSIISSSWPSALPLPVARHTAVKQTTYSFHTLNRCNSR